MARPRCYALFGHCCWAVLLLLGLQQNVNASGEDSGSSDAISAGHSQLRASDVETRDPTVAPAEGTHVEGSALDNIVDNPGPDRPFSPGHTVEGPSIQQEGSAEFIRPMPPSEPSVHRGTAAGLLAVTLAVIFLCAGAAAHHVWKVPGGDSTTEAMVRVEKLKALLSDVELLARAVGTEDAGRLWATVQHSFSAAEQARQEVAKLRKGKLAFAREPAREQELRETMQSAVEDALHAVQLLHDSARKQVVEIVQGIHPMEPLSPWAETVEDISADILGRDYASAVVKLMKSFDYDVRYLTLNANLAQEHCIQEQQFKDENDAALLVSSLIRLQYVQFAKMGTVSANNAATGLKKSTLGAAKAAVTSELVYHARVYRIALERLKMCFKVYQASSETKEPEVSRAFEDGLAVAHLHYGQLVAMFSELGRCKSVECTSQMKTKVAATAATLKLLVEHRERRMPSVPKVAEGVEFREIISEFSSNVMKHVEQESVGVKDILAIMEQPTLQASPAGPDGTAGRRPFICAKYLQSLVAGVRRAADDAASSVDACTRLTQEIMQTDTLERALEMTGDVFAEGAKAAKARQTAEALHVQYALLRSLEKDMAGSADAVAGASVGKLDPSSHEVKKIQAFKEEIEKERGVAADASSLSQIAASAAHMRSRAEKVDYIVYKGTARLREVQ